MTAPRSSAAASPRLLDLRLPPLTLLDGGTVDPHHARVQWWGPETDLPLLERLGTQVSPDATGPLARSAPVRAGSGHGLDPSVPTVVVVHALTGDARAAGPGGWWGPLVGPGTRVGGNVRTCASLLFQNRCCHTLFHSGSPS